MSKRKMLEGQLTLSWFYVENVSRGRPNTRDPILSKDRPNTRDPILSKDSSAVASAPAESMPEATVAPPNGLTASSSKLLCL